MTRMIVRTTDRDVVVPEVINAQKIHATEIWVPCGVWKIFSYIPAHQVASQLGPCPASALPVFHPSTGCDTVSCFAGKGRGRACKVWQGYPEDKYVFLSLFSGPDVLDESF